MFFKFYSFVQIVLCQTCVLMCIFFKLMLNNYFSNYVNNVLFFMIFTCCNHTAAWNFLYHLITQECNSMRIPWHVVLFLSILLTRTDFSFSTVLLISVIRWGHLHGHLGLGELVNKENSCPVSSHAYKSNQRTCWLSG